jgi:hypothetical protein
MSDVFRLDAISITNLPQRVQSDPITPEGTIVSVVLHAPRLPAHQHLEVTVNGVVQAGVAEGEQIAFSWQWKKATDEASINVFRRGALVHHWQGRWDECDVIVHQGLLPIQIFLNGKPVKARSGFTSSATVATLSSAQDATSGNRHSAAIVEPEHDTPGATIQANEQNNGAAPVVVQDLLVLPELLSGVMAPHSNHEEGEETVEESGTAPSDEGSAARPDGTEGSEREEKLVRDEEPEPFARQDARPATTERTAVWPRLVPFHLNSLHEEETVAELKALLARMPKTILVDLRHHPRIARKTSEPRDLSKERLRAVFGGIYWERGWAIQTQSCLDVVDRVPRLRQILVHPDQDPDGIPSLVKQLQAGYSLVVMDERASYAESPRRAVIEELHKRLPDVIVGPVEVSQEGVEVH